MDLTKKEEEIMQILWRLKKASVKEIIAELPEPKPHRNTVSTFIRIMESKNIVGFESVGKGYRYFPLLKQSKYKDQSLKKLVNGYFEKSPKGLVAYFAKKEKISTQELRDIIDMIENEKS